MHRTRQAARNVAWQDSNNPFAKRWNIDWKKEKNSAQNDVETGAGIVYPRSSSVDNSLGHRAATFDDRILEHDGAIATTEIAVRPSVRRVATAPVASNRAEVKSKVVEAHEEPIEHHDDRGQPRGLRGLLQRRSTDCEDELSRNEGKHKQRQQFTTLGQIKVIFFSSWLKVVLLPFVPAGFAVNYTHRNAVVIFAINFVAIFPLTLMLSESADELMLRVGDNLGALINLSFCNAVQFITSIFLLRNNQIQILQTTLIGAILSSMHLMLGLSFLVGGAMRIEQAYNTTVAKVSANLLMLAMVSLILPTMADRMGSITPEHITKLSRGIAVILVLVYLVFLFFQLKSHSALYYHPSEKNQTRNIQIHKQRIKNMLPDKLQRRSVLSEDISDREEEDEQERDTEPRLSTLTFSIVLVVCTTLLAFNVAFATDNLDGLMSRTTLSPTFIGIVLLPLLSNDFTIMGPAIQDKMDLCVALTIGKCLQTILLVVPFTVILGWIMRRNMTLDFDAFEATALFASVIYICSMIQGGKSNYLDGVLLISVFMIICLTSYWV